MKKYVLIAGIVILGIAILRIQQLSGRSPDSAEQNQSTTAASLISPDRYDELANDPEVFILDVHTPEQAHLPGTDAFIPDADVVARAQELPADKQTPIVVYCRSGSMSGRVSKELVKLGYTTVYELEGGTDTYKKTKQLVYVQPAVHNFGTVIYGDVVTTTFTLTNFTPDPLEITKVSTSCGCTSAQAEKTSLAPYESTAVNVSFDPAVHKDDTDLGDLTRTIYLETSAPDFQKLSAEITATVIKK